MVKTDCRTQSSGFYPREKVFTNAQKIKIEKLGKYKNTKIQNMTDDKIVSDNILRHDNYSILHKDVADALFFIKNKRIDSF